MNNNRFSIFIISLFFCFSLSTVSSVAFGENLSPELVKISTPVYHPQLSNFDPRFGTYTYGVSWQGIPAATVKVRFEKEGFNYLTEVESWTASAIDLFYSLRFRAEGVMSTVDMMPVRTLIDHRENSRHKITQVSFLPNDEILSVSTKVGKGTEVHRFNPNNFTLDPFSAAFIAKTLEWKEGETRSFDVFNGRTRYLITLTATGKKKMRFEGADKSVWVIVPTVKNLTNPEKSKKFRHAEIYLSDDAQRDILEIKSEVFVGSVSTSLESFVPSNRADSGANVALKDDETAHGRLR